MNNKGYTLIELMITITVVGVIAALAIPAYQDYVTRSQVAEGIALFDGKRVAAEEYMSNFGINDNKFFRKEAVSVNSSYIQEMQEIYGDGGLIGSGKKAYQIGILYGNDATKNLTNKFLVFYGNSNETNNYIWNCSTNIDDKYLPPSLNCTLDLDDDSVTNPTNPDVDNEYQFSCNTDAGYVLVPHTSGGFGCTFNGEYHSEDGKPAVKMENERGTVYEWMNNGSLHREDGPASVSFDPNGVKSSEDYWINGVRHRDDGPAYVSYDENGNLDYQAYYNKGELHREDGPAIIFIDDDTGEIVENYYLNGRKVDKCDVVTC